MIRKTLTKTHSAKAAVLRAYPAAFAHSWSDCWNIYSGQVVGRCTMNVTLGQGKTAALAWADALQKMSPNAKVSST